MDTYHRFEVTILDFPLEQLEIDCFKLYAEKHKIGMSVSQSGLIICFDKVKNIKSLIKILAEIGLAEEVGLIREITEYNPHIEYEEFLDE